MSKVMRLDKFLSEMGIASRKETKEYAKKGRIKVNDAIVKSSDYKIDTDKDIVTFDGRTIAYEQFEYYMLNKPAGVVSATVDNNDRTVIDLIDSERKKDLFPVGRLDKDTVGLLIITNDGELAHSLLSPVKHIDKKYFARVEGTLPAPESSHAIRAAIDEALKCKETGEEKTILFGLTGTGYFDMVAYQKFNDGEMSDFIPSDEDIAKSLANLPEIK